MMLLAVPSLWMPPDDPSWVPVTAIMASLSMSQVIMLSSSGCRATTATPTATSLVVACAKLRPFAVADATTVWTTAIPGMSKWK